MTESLWGSAFAGLLFSGGTMLRSLTPSARSLLMSLVCALLLGCAGSHLEGRTYRDDEFAFRLGPLPSARFINADDALVAFRDDEAQSTIAVSARCGQDGDDVPLRALVQHLFIRFAEQETISETEFRLAGRAALEVELTANLEGVRSRFIVVVLKRNGCVYDFLHIDAGGQNAETVRSREDFRKMVRGFTILD